MGKRGPKQIPPSLLKLRGARETSETRNAPTAGAALVACGTPQRPNFDDDHVARLTWDTLIEDMAGIDGLLARVDANALELYCRLWSRWKVLDSVTPHDMEPSTKFLSLVENLSRLGQQFGMTPASRIRAPKSAPTTAEAGPDKSRFFAAAKTA